jgi:glutathione S-transferase
MAVRWALAECGQDYRIDPLSFADLKTPEHKARQPFGQPFGRKARDRTRRVWTL